MFKLTETKKFEANIEISDVGENGSFRVLFEKIPQDERMAIVEEEGVTALLDRIVVEVFDVEVEGISDKDKIKEIVINDSCASSALVRTYAKKTDGIVRKNSKKSRRNSSTLRA